MPSFAPTTSPTTYERKDESDGGNDNTIYIVVMGVVLPCLVFPFFLIPWYRRWKLTGLLPGVKAEGAWDSGLRGSESRHILVAMMSGVFVTKGKPTGLE